MFMITNINIYKWSIWLYHGNYIIIIDGHKQEKRESELFTAHMRVRYARYFYFNH